MKNILGAISKLATALGAIAAATSVAVVLAAAPEWRGFRGDGRSVAEGARLPLSWSVETGDNVAWRADLPGRGVSAPIVVDGRVIVTCSSGPRENRLHVAAFDEATGRELWHRQFWATGRTLIHPTTAVAANTPVSDGQRVFAFFSSNDLLALDLDGNVQWIRGLQFNHPLAGNDVGMASSPAIVDGAVVVQSEAQGEAFVAAFDARDGALRWQHDRAKKPSWCTPMMVQQQAGGKSIEAALVMSQDGFDVYRGDTGERLWGQAIGCATIPSAVVDADAIYVPAQGLSKFAFDPATQAGKNLWKESRLQVGNPSPVIYRDHAYVINNAGVLTCTKIGADDIAWRLRLGGQFWATPVATGDRLYCVSSAGKAYVVELGDKGRVAAENDFGQEVLASPAVAGDALYVRGYNRLWKIADKANDLARAGGL